MAKGQGNGTQWHAIFDDRRHQTGLRPDDRHLSCGECREVADLLSGRHSHGKIVAHRDPPRTHGAHICAPNLHPDAKPQSPTCHYSCIGLCHGNISALSTSPARPPRPSPPSRRACAPSALPPSSPPVQPTHMQQRARHAGRHTCRRAVPWNGGGSHAQSEKPCQVKSSPTAARRDGLRRGPRRGAGLAAARPSRAPWRATASPRARSHGAARRRPATGGHVST
jgi:hypothetical protein